MLPCCVNSNSNIGNLKKKEGKEVMGLEKLKKLFSNWIRFFKFFCFSFCNRSFLIHKTAEFTHLITTSIFKTYILVFHSYFHSRCFNV